MKLIKQKVVALHYLFSSLFNYFLFLFMAAV